ncbi:MAG: DUF1194 domain-containing protein [Alphaproteobacteria bacterium]|nr:DUF1194 domain-containing protein [Alphaproteobacteria bacterium]
MSRPLAVKLLAASLAAAALALSAPAQAEIPVDLELVLAVDVSGSIDNQEATLQRDGYVAALAHPKVIAAIKAGAYGRIAVTYVEWAGVNFQNVIIPWRLISDEASARRFSAELSDAAFTRERYTSISGGIQFAMPLFDHNGYEGLRRVIDVSGDGPNNRGGYVDLVRDVAVGRGIIINGLPILNDRFVGFGGQNLPDLDLYYEKCVIGGPGSFLIAAKDFGDFSQAILKKLILEIADLGPPTGVIPVAERVAPPCDIGERLQRARSRVSLRAKHALAASGRMEP